MLLNYSIESVHRIMEKQISCDRCSWWTTLRSRKWLIFGLFISNYTTTYLDMHLFQMKKYIVVVMATII